MQNLVRGPSEQNGGVLMVENREVSSRAGWNASWLVRSSLPEVAAGPHE